jgi:hypothetical protein
MLIYQHPKLEDYEKGIPKSIWDLYKGMSWDDRYKIEMDTFEDTEKAITIIKDWMDKGAVVFSHFTNDYSKFIIFRDEDTDEYIKAAKKEKGGEKQVQRKED